MAKISVLDPKCLNSISNYKARFYTFAEHTYMQVNERPRL